MANTIYKSETVELIDGSTIYITPLKIKYLREFMDKFLNIKKAKDDDDALLGLLDCIVTCMKQFKPEIDTIEKAEDVMDTETMYTILEVSADVSIRNKGEEDPAPKEAVNNSKGNTWDSLDLSKLESELFLLGIWKDYEDLETSLSMPELMATLAAKRELDYAEKKFFAAIQGVDLDEQTGKNKDEEDPWERVKARAAAITRGEDPDKVTMADPNDITSFQGLKAQQAGFGIGMGLEYSTV